MRPTPYVASLRIYEPLSAFEEADRLRWSEIEITQRTSRDEQTLALRRIILPESPVLGPDGAHILEIDGVRYISPWSTATRCWSALDDFKSSLPSTVSTYFLPAKLEAAITLGAEYTESKVPHILSETWIIPPRWFALFIPEERVRGHDNEGAFTVAHATIALAKERCEIAHLAVLWQFL